MEGAIAKLVPTGGTTADVVGVDWSWADSLAHDQPGARVRLIDTPGLEEVDHEGEARGELATLAADRADLILFVLAEDLTSTARLALIALQTSGKPILVVVNKVDLLDDDARLDVLASIRERLVSIIPPENVVEASASPIVRRRISDDAGQLVRVETVRGEPDVTHLQARLREILAASSVDLRGARQLEGRGRTP